MLDAAGTQLRDGMLELFRMDVDDTLDDPEFDRRALDIFNYQLERNSPYNAYCTRRGRTSSNVTHWSEIPPVPTAAFKEVALVSGNAESAEAVFRTSGTTGGHEKRGAHYIIDLSLYNASLIPSFAGRLLPERTPMTMLSLIPPASEMRDSSLAHMVAQVMTDLGGEGSGYYAGVEAGIDIPRLEAALRMLIDRNVAVCILGTSFSFVHWLDSIMARDTRFVLPAGSRLMDTGGYKGRSREVPANEMLASYEERFGIPAYACINEYGMTELCSQMYDVTLSDYVSKGRPGTRRKRPPPWMRIRIVDPVTLTPVSDGEKGLVQIFDLANIGSVIAVQTEDVGVKVEDGCQILGRAPGSQPRGCSIAMDDLQQAMRTLRKS